MKIYHSLTILFLAFKSKSADEIRLTAVAFTYDMEKLYLRTRSASASNQSAFEANETSDLDMKKLICRYIANSAFFDMFEEDAIDDIDKIYPELESLYQNNEDEDRELYKKLMEAFANNDSFEKVFTYPTENTRFTIVAHIVLEHSFVCPTRRRDSGKIMLNYISDARNINDALEVPVEGYIAARFICRMIFNVCSIIAIAEEPATVVTSSQYSVEDLYLQMKKFYKPADKESEDPVCKLSKAEKLRICGSVLNSTYFDGKIKYVPNGRLFLDHCEMLKVSFRTDRAEAKIGNTAHAEWAISCSAEPISDDAEMNYFISRAYNTQMAFVYTRDYSTTDMYKLENLSKNVSVIIDECIQPFCLTMQL